MTSTEVIRLRHDADLAACVESLWAVHRNDAYPSKWPADPSAWLTPRGMVDAWVAVDNDAILGHVALASTSDVTESVAAALGSQATSGVLSVARLFVNPAARGHGLAASLLDRTIESARQMGQPVVLDVVAEGKAAIALYERQGWRRVGSGLAAWQDQQGDHPLIHYYVAPD